MTHYFRWVALLLGCWLVRFAIRDERVRQYVTKIVGDWIAADSEFNVVPKSADVR